MLYIIACILQLANAVQSSCLASATVKMPTLASRPEPSEVQTVCGSNNQDQGHA